MRNPRLTEAVDTKAIAGPNGEWHSPTRGPDDSVIPVWAFEDDEFDEQGIEYL